MRMISEGFAVAAVGMVSVFLFLGMQILAMRCLALLVRRFSRKDAQGVPPDADPGAPGELALIAASIAIATFERKGDRRCHAS